jgi:hypothetical protein
LKSPDDILNQPSILIAALGSTGAAPAAAGSAGAAAGSAGAAAGSAGGGGSYLLRPYLLEYLDD